VSFRARDEFLLTPVGDLILPRLGSQALEIVVLVQNFLRMKGWRIYHLSSRSREHHTIGNLHKRLGPIRFFRLACESFPERHFECHHLIDAARTGICA
jgi:hypothetical protein